MGAAPFGAEEPATAGDALPPACAFATPGTAIAPTSVNTNTRADPCRLPVTQFPRIMM
jgi:hypothetical protein